MSGRVPNYKQGRRGLYDAKRLSHLKRGSSPGPRMSKTMKLLKKLREIDAELYERMPHLWPRR